MNTLFLVALIVEGLVGIGFVFAPVQMMAPYGVDVNGVACAFVRLLGSALLSFPVLLWLARKSDKIEFKMGAAWSMSAYYLVSTALLMRTQVLGRMNSLGWGMVAIHVIFLVWFGYFLVKKPS